MKRYYLCPVNLYQDQDGLFYSAKIREYPGFDFVAEIPNQADGKPKENWALVHVSGNDFSVLDNDPDFVFVSDNPDLEVEVNVSGKLDKALRDRGINLSKSKMKRRDLVRSIGKKLSQNFEENNFRIGGQE